MLFFPQVTDCQSDLNTDIPWYVRIPSEASNKSRLENNGRAVLVVLRFKNMGKVLTIKTFKNSMFEHFK